MLHPFDASAAKYMEFCDEEDMVDMYGPLNLHDKLAVFCPLNDAQSVSGGGSHWAMLVLIRTALDGELSAFLLDSGSGNMEAYARGSVSKLKPLMRVQGEVNVEEVQNYPKQENMSDCGVFSICGA